MDTEQNGTASVFHTDSHLPLSIKVSDKEKEAIAKAEAGAASSKLAVADAYHQMLQVRAKLDDFEAKLKRTYENSMELNQIYRDTIKGFAQRHGINPEDNGWAYNNQDGEFVRR